MTMMVMVFVFQFLAKMKGDPGIPYPLMVLSGLTIWIFFSNSFMQISNSIVVNSNLVSKVYFPRLLMPLSSIAVGFVDFLLTFIILVALMFHYHHPLSWNVVFLPVVLFLTFVTALGFGLFFAVINVKFRDIGQLIPFMIQVGTWACPISYSSSLARGTWFEPYYNLNPLVGIIDGFRWCLLGEKASFNPQTLGYTAIISFVVLVLSLIYFRKKENTFVDHI
jgi:lipopolysaccharide transport system permease protein